MMKTYGGMKVIEQLRFFDFDARLREGTQIRRETNISPAITIFPYLPY